MSYMFYSSLPQLIFAKPYQIIRNVGLRAYIQFDVFDLCCSRVIQAYLVLYLSETQLFLNLKTNDFNFEDLIASTFTCVW